MATREKNIWILLLFIFAGIVVGGLLRRACIRYRVSMVAWLWRKFWAFTTSCIGSKYYNIYIWNPDENKYCKYYRNGNSIIYIQENLRRIAIKRKLLKWGLYKKKGSKIYVT